MQNYQFDYNERLGIEIPTFYMDWNQLGAEEQYDVLFHWEKVRSQIPDRIKELEEMVHQRELQLQVEDDFQRFCQLSDEITDLASRIIDLNLWFRTQDEVSSDKTHL